MYLGRSLSKTIVKLNMIIRDFKKLKVLIRTKRNLKKGLKINTN